MRTTFTAMVVEEASAKDKDESYEVMNEDRD